MNKVIYWGAVISADPFPALAPFGNPDMSWGTAKSQWGQGLCSGEDLGCSEQRRRGCKTFHLPEMLGLNVFPSLPPS